MKKISIIFLLLAIITGCTPQEGINELEETKAELLTYESPTYPFTFQYPKDWIIDEEDKYKQFGTKWQNKAVQLRTPEREANLATENTVVSADVAIFVYDSIDELSANGQSKNLEEWINKEALSQGYTKIDKTWFDEVPGFKALAGSQDALDPVIFMEHNNKIYLLINQKEVDPNEIEEPVERQTFEKLEKEKEIIMSSFKFTDEGFITYRNEQYGFQLKMPSTWDGYQVEEIKNNEGKFAGLDFGFIINGQFVGRFHVGIHNKNNWPQKNGESLKVGENSKYIFSFEGPQDYIQELKEIATDAPKIKASFQAIEPKQ